MEEKLVEIEKLNENKAQKNVKDNKLKVLGDIQGMIRDHKTRIHGDPLNQGSTNNLTGQCYSNINGINPNFVLSQKSGLQLSSHKYKVN